MDARSIEEDKLLESALAEHWELDNRCGTTLRSFVKGCLFHQVPCRAWNVCLPKSTCACRVDKIALKLPRKSKEAVKHRIHLLEVRSVM